MKKSIVILLLLLVTISNVCSSSIAEIGCRNELLNGRGRSDSGRDEPNYCGIIGYVVIGYDEAYEIERTDKFENKKLWVVPTYLRDNQEYRKKGNLPHKTEVLVKEQYLKHKSHGNYNGYLLVEKTDNGKQYIIDVNNFITKPYWTYVNDLQKAALTGDYVAVYQQVSTNKPVTGSDFEVDIKNGTKVLVTGINSEYKGRIEAIVWKKWKLGYGGVDCYFDTADLSIIY